MKDNEKRKRKKDRFHLILLIILALLFFFGIGHNGYMLEADSYNYIACNFGREPLYPIFLLLFRVIFGEGVYFHAVWIFQSLLGVCAVVYCALWMKRRFRLKDGVLYLVFFLLLLPYWFVTVWYTPLGLWTNRILTEGLTFSLYYLFLVAAIKTIYDRKLRDFAIMCLLSVVLSALRSQMLVCFVICLGMMVWLLIAEKKTREVKRICAACVAVVLAAGGLYCGVKAVYKYRITDSSEEAETLGLALLSNLLYSSDREDADCYEDPELRMIFEDLYALTDERHLNHQYAGESSSVGDHRYDAHDVIKYEVINEVYYRYVYKEGSYQDRVSNRNLEEFIRDLEGPLLRRNWHRLIKDSLYEWPKAYMRSIFTASDILFPFNGVFCAVMYISALYLCIRCIVKGRAWKSAVPMLIVMAVIVMSVAGVALTIYVSMRYLSYNLGMFYIAYMILLLQYDKTAKLLRED